MSMRYPGGFIASTPVTAAYPSGVWTQAQAIPYQAQNVWTRDQYWPYTTLLLQGDGAVNGAQNNTFLDSSTNNFTITRNGNTTQGAFTPYEQDGYWSNFFGGSSDYLTLANNAAFDLGTGDCTIEAWIFTNSLSATQAIFSAFPGSGTISGYTFLVGTSGTISVDSWVSGTNQGAAASNYPVSVGSWFHVAYTRSGGTNRIFVNGNLCTLSTNTLTQALNTGGNTPKIGYQGYSGFLYPFNGYISNLRIVKGTAVYTAAFTPSAAPLTAITNTSLLTCQSNRFKDNSTNNFTISTSGSPSVQAFQPFPGATTWSGSVLGGSGYFDGTGDYLSDIGTTSSFNFMHNSSALWTWECWAYIPSPSTNQYFIDNTNGTSNQIGLYLGIESSKLIFAITRGSSGTLVASGFSTDNVPANQWVHLAITYDQSLGSSNGKFYINGVASGTVNKTANAPSSSNASNAMRVACFGSGAGGFITGYISNMRISNSVVYASAFTPPTSPVTGGALLLNFTNAGIFDAAVMNDLETVGNAQVSTSVVKYGTGSMYFDGNGDYLLPPSSPNLAFGTGDCTIEFWYYANSSQGTRTILVGNNLGFTTNAWNIQINNTSPSITNKLQLWAYNLNSSAVAIQGNTTLVANNWYHVALVRNGSTFTFYLNGVSEGTTTSSASLDGGGSKTVSIARDGTDYFNGYLDDLRITKGAARYLTSFTPPPARMPGQ